MSKHTSYHVGPGPMNRKCTFYSDTLIRALATRVEYCKKHFPLMNRHDRRTLVKYYKMHLKGTLRHGI